jgi:hypothetical protein
MSSCDHLTKPCSDPRRTREEPSDREVEVDEIHAVDDGQTHAVSFESSAFDALRGARRSERELAEALRPPRERIPPKAHAAELCALGVEAGGHLAGRRRRLRGCRKRTGIDRREHRRISVEIQYYLIGTFKKETQKVSMPALDSMNYFNGTDFLHLYIKFRLRYRRDDRNLRTKRSSISRIDEANCVGAIISLSESGQILSGRDSSE